MAKDEYGLTPRQRRFCDLYIKYGDGVKAAREAGYKSPENSSRKNTENYVLKQYIDKRMKAMDAARIASAEEVLKYLTGVMRGEVKDQFGLDASLQDRTKAAQELMKRYAVADQRQASTMARLDSLFVEFRAALQAEPTKASEDETPPPSDA